MPRFLLETPPMSGNEGNEVVVVAAQRYPEIAVEHRYDAGDRDGERRRVLWVCRAPSALHLRRWAHTARLSVIAISSITRSEEQ